MDMKRTTTTIEADSRSPIKRKRLLYGNYTTTYNEVYQRPDLSARAKGIFIYIMTLPEDWKIYKEEIFNHFTEGYTALNTAFKELETMGYIFKERSKNKKGQFIGWEYTIQDYADEAPDKTRLSRNRPVGYPDLLSTNKLINKEKKNNTKTKEKQTTNNTTILPLDKVLEYFPQDWIDDETFQSTMKDFHAHRREIRKPLKHTSTKLLATKLLKYDIGIAIESLSTSIQNGWTGVFPDKGDDAPRPDKKGNPTKKGVASGRSPRDIIEKHFTWTTGRYKGRLNKYSSEPFLKDIYIPARDWLGGKDSPELTRQLLDMFEDMNDIKKKNIKPDERNLVPSTFIFMERYIEWLEDNNWITNRNVRLFDISHKLFSQFRREEARRYGYQQRDSLTGVSYVL